MYRYFNLKEFDSPDEVGSGGKMRAEFLRRLDTARHISQTPYIITSGFRSIAANNDLIKRGYRASRNSSHLKGWAADIQANDSRTRHRILKGLIEAGFNRIGISGAGFIHVDADPSKKEAVWLYPLNQ